MGVSSSHNFWVYLLKYTPLLKLMEWWWYFKADWWDVTDILERPEYDMQNQKHSQQYLWKPVRKICKIDKNLHYHHIYFKILTDWCTTVLTALLILVKVTNLPLIVTLISSFWIPLLGLVYSFNNVLNHFKINLFVQYIWSNLKKPNSLNWHVHEVESQVDAQYLSVNCAEGKGRN